MQYATAPSTAGNCARLQPLIQVGIKNLNCFRQAEYYTSPALFYKTSTYNFTYSAWVNPNLSHTIPPEGVYILTTNQMNLVSNAQCVMHPTHGQSYGNPLQHAGAGLYVGTNSVFVLEHSDNYIKTALVYAAALTGWHLYTIVYDNKIPQLYIDGQYVKTGVGDTRNVYPSIGYDNNTIANYANSGFGAGFNGISQNTTQYFDGKSDELSFWNRKLSANEINQMYNITSAPLLPAVTWSTGDTSQSIIVSPNIDTTYYAYSSNGCVDSIHITVYQPTSFTINQSICQPANYLGYSTQALILIL